MIKNLLVVGGAGFIGSAFCKMMIEKYPDINLTVFDALTYAGTLESIEEYIKKGKINFIHGDITSRHQVQAALKNCDSVVNFAAHSHVDRSIIDTTPFLLTNTAGVVNILDSIKDLKMGHRYLQISTDECHGDAPPNVWFTEEDVLHPSNPYSASKAAADMFVMAYVRTHNINAVITRCTNNYGPYQYPEKLVAMTITSIMDGKKVPIHGDGKMLRDWIWVDDHCDGIARVLVDGEKGQIYNMAGLCERSTIDVVEKVAEYFGKKLDDVVQYIPNRPGQDLRYAISPGKIMSALGWRPGNSFEENLPTLVEWYKNHQSWWRKIQETDHYRLHMNKLKKGL